APGTSSREAAVSREESESRRAWEAIGIKSEVASSFNPNQKFETKIQKSPGVPFGTSLAEHAKLMARFGVPIDPEDLEIAARIAEASGTPLHKQLPIEPPTSPPPDSGSDAFPDQTSESQNPNS